MNQQINIHLRALTDDGFFYEKVLNQNCYRLRTLKNDKEKFTVVDVGAGTGLFALCVLGIGCNDIHCFEPLLDNFAVLLKNTDFFGEAVKQYPFGISEHGDVKNFYPIDSIGRVLLFGSPRLTANAPDEKPTNNVGVFLSPKEFVSKINLHNGIDLLKINTGSYQPEAFSEALLSLAKNLCAEVQGISIEELKSLRVRLSVAGFIDFKILNTDYDKSYTGEEVQKANFIFCASKTSCSECFLVEDLKNPTIESII